MNRSLLIDFTEGLNIEPGPIAPFSVNFIYVPRPPDRPVLITIDVQLDAARGPELDSFVNELRLIYLRNGAYSWQLFADSALTYDALLPSIFPKISCVELGKVKPIH